MYHIVVRWSRMLQYCCKKSPSCGGHILARSLLWSWALLEEMIYPITILKHPWWLRDAIFSLVDIGLEPQTVTLQVTNLKINPYGGNLVMIYKQVIIVPDKWQVSSIALTWCYFVAGQKFVCCRCIAVHGISVPWNGWQLLTKRREYFK